MSIGLKKFLQMVATEEETMWRAALISTLSVTIALSTAALSASDDDSFWLANDLGIIIGSEEFCGLMYDQTAIANYIQNHVKADDLRFNHYFEETAQNTRFYNKDLTDSEKTARCMQITRNAKALGFVK